MANKLLQSVHTARAPAAIGPYSQAMQFGDLVFISGQLGLDPETGLLVSGGVAPQTQQIIQNLLNIGAAAGSKPNQCLKLTFYLTDLADFETVNALLSDALTEPFPARATVGVAALPKGAAIEIDAIMAGSNG
ncbi:Rid family detoxifying hydrolase [Pseudomonadales bacterium]|nr:Rid family detoxifying hydrolase [Pseudomonadales bacterium]MDA8949156.1 Rid family detoxifying hydrolase [Pseudomonadales bacterium]